MKRTAFTLLCFLSLWKSTVAQSIEQCYDLAVDAYDRQDFVQAESMLLRVCFFDITNKIKSDAYIYLAHIQQINENYNQCYRYFDLAEIYCSNPDKKIEISLEKSRTMILQKEFNQALQVLYEIETNSDLLLNLKRLYLGIALYGTNDYKAAIFHFNKILSQPLDSTYLNGLETILNRKLNTSKIKIAGLISYLIPGSGQTLAGFPLSGLNSAILVAAIFYVYIVTAQTYSVLSSVISILPWLSRYYRGGSENAKRLMRQRIDKNKNKYFNEILLRCSPELVNWQM